ncbi:MAG: TIGR04283 family arsenosugar biosynthesis glycosyltransferase [Planctomycetota bacterium]|jgi:rSAM/selenodomain-associated transferase 2
MDEHNHELVRDVRPSDWRNPTPEGRYNLVVIGAGTGGLVTAAGAAGLGAMVALVERNLLGGDCLNYGCVPSKTLIRASRAAADARRSGELGVHIAGDVEVDFAKVMERVRRVRARISRHDSAERFAGLGVDVYLGEARFVGRRAVEVEGTRLEFSKAVIATGARAAAPHINGLDKVGYLTNETVFELTELPRRLAVVGGGPIGCELAQAFRRLGSEVHLVHKHGHILNREDADAAEIVQDAFAREGVDLLLGCETISAERRGEAKVLRLRHEDLTVWERARAKADAEGGITVVIPALNEAENVASAVSSAASEGTEVIVADGGSTDATREVARSSGARVVRSPPGRARQMNAGAEDASGDILVFLHADTKLPKGYARHVRRALRRPGVAGGAFRFGVDLAGRRYRILERLVNWRSEALSLPYGDQALFMRARDLRRMGGLRDMLILEDVDLIRRLHHMGRVAVCPATVTTSGRRWRERGGLRATLGNLLAISAYFIGMPPAQVVRWRR